MAVPPAAEVHAGKRRAGERVVGLPAVHLLDVPVAPVAGHQHRDGHRVQILEVVAVEPELGVVRRRAVALHGVLNLLAHVEVALQPGRPVGIGVVGGRRYGQSEVEPERRVHALVPGCARSFVAEGLGGVEVADAVGECVVIPAVDGRLGHDGHQVGRMHDRRRVLRGAVVRAAEHADLAIGPGLRGDRLDDVVRGLLLTHAAVVPAAAGVAGADHVGVRA